MKSSISRRKILQAYGGVALYWGLASPMMLASGNLYARQPTTPTCSKATPPQMEGPFFTPRSPERHKLIEPNAKAPRMRLTGQVIDSLCRPVPGALLDFWQCDDQGHYDNHGHRLRGHQYTNNNGEFALETVVPGEYPGRTRHLHVKIYRKNGPILTTQLYFPDQPANGSDFLFDPRLLMSYRESAFQFQFVLPA